MDNDIYTENILVKVAWYYYKENLTQHEIAVMLGVSRNKVVRLLDKARADGIVQFQIKGKSSNCLEIEQDLKKKYNLPNAFVIPTPVNPSDLSHSLAKATAQYIQSKIEKHDLLGFGWGKAVSDTIDCLSIDSDYDLSMVTLTGGVNYYLPNSNVGSSGIGKFQKMHIIPTPFLASTEEMASKFLNEPSVKEILDLSKLTRYMVVGIGGISTEATIIVEEKLTIHELTHIKQQNAVGDILGQFFNKDGEVLNLPHHYRLIGTRLSLLKELNNVIAVAGGANKVIAIFGALKGKYVQTLVTDETTAQSLLEMEVD
ncbi:sugar-binding transcriptional regulator [Bacillus sp. JJ722]|uniref:sugar-binding transcriptional regulator n=1 Tax=Bacillus sp. JJ722 TaxID=3122973 RepID=UPI002FFD74BA